MLPKLRLVCLFKQKTAYEMRISDWSSAVCSSDLLMRARDMSANALEHMLYHESGLLCLSVISGDARMLAESDAASADEALEIFAFRVAREAAALATTIGDRKSTRLNSSP